MFLKALLDFILVKAPTHYVPYGARCQVDRNFSIINQKITLYNMPEPTGNVAEHNVCL